jgi:hypothetical protein
MLKPILALALWSAVSVVQAAPIALSVGGTTIQFPMDANYVQLSSTQPQLFAFTQAALPSTNRLVESLMTRDDVDRAGHSEKANDIYYQVQVLRAAEARQISIDDWNALKPQITAGMNQADMNHVLSNTSANNDRMSAVAGKQVSVSFGNVGAPVIYRQTSQSVSFGMLVPLQISVNGQPTSMTIAAAGAFALVHNKLLYIYAFNPKTSDADIADVRQHLNGVVDQTLAMNQSDTSVPSSTSVSFNWSGVGRSALLWGIVGGLIALVGTIFGRRK